MEKDRDGVRRRGNKLARERLIRTERGKRKREDE